MNTMATIMRRIAVGAVVLAVQAVSAAEGPVQKSDGVYDNRTQLANATAAASVLAAEMSKNVVSMSRMMTVQAKKDWAAVCRRMCVDGKQYFLPDFCKVKYTFIGKCDKNGFVCGFYNPFYDAFMLVSMENLDAQPRIDGFRFATVHKLTGKTEPDVVPSASGTNPSEAYFPAVAEQLKSAGAAFNGKFLGSDSRAALAALPVIDETQIAEMTNILKFRLGQLVVMGDDAKVRKDAVLANLLVRDANFAEKNILIKDHGTRTTLDTLAGGLAKMRGKFKVVAYFPDKAAANFIYFNSEMPSLLVQSHVEGEKMWLKMMDAHAIEVKQTK